MNGMRKYEKETDEHLVKEAIKVADAFGLGYISAVKNALELNDIIPPKPEILDQIIFNLLF
jgi:hypothetical protein